MEWNAKPLGQWDWEHFFFMNGKATENPKLQPSTNWLGEADREVNIGALYPSGGSGCSVSELFHTSFSRSSKSASNNSSSNGDSKFSMLTQEGSQDGSTVKKELLVETSPTTEPSAVSGEPLLTLKLGKRFYFEDVSIGSGSKKLASSVVLLSGKKGKSGQNLIPASCQVEGCGLDLSSAKDYHRKHRVCETHSKSPMVVIDGFECRFCQQCSRFHALPEFDDQKRSCRRRLADHNARRRKPQPEALQLNPPALPLSPYGTNLKNGRQVMGPYAFSRNATNLAWHEHDIRNTSSKLPQTKDFLLKPTKDFHKMPNTMLSDDSSGLLASKGIGTKTTFPGIEDPNDTQDVNRALSLLSTNSWDAYETKPLSLQHSDPTTSITQTRTHTVSQRLPLPSSEYWHTDHQLANSGTCVPYLDYDNSSRFQDFQLLNAPFESSFPCNGLD